jgi:tetratricopeptide (TPR) repeat protein
LHGARGETAAAVTLYEQAIIAFQRHQDLLDQGRVLNNLGFVQQQSGDLDVSLASYRRALELLTRVGDVREQGLVHLHMAEVALRMRSLDDAREHCMQANRRFVRIGFEPGLADVDRVYAGIASWQRRWPVAEHYLREALAVYETYGDQLNIAETQKSWGDCSNRWATPNEPRGAGAFAESLPCAAGENGSQ